MRIITKQQATRFILIKQGLIGPYRFTGKGGAYDYVRQAGCIQFDPVDVCGKNAELTLQSRVKGFKKSMLRELLYEDRKLIDYVDKELSIWPVEDWPYFAPFRERSRRMSDTFEGLQELKESAISYIKENGPVCSDTLPIEGEIFWHSSMHWSGNWHKKSPAARSVLEQLYTDGELIIHHKNGSRKYYDIAEKYLPANILNSENPCKDEFEFASWRVLRRIGAVGLLWDKNSTAYLGIDLKAELRKKVLHDLLADEKVRSVMVEGIKVPFYYRTEDEVFMQEALDESTKLTPRMSFIAPLDPLLWDKALILALWDFRYSWEIYTPAIKRKYGYYTLPILYGDRFVGRIEAIPDRREGVLQVKGLWWEPGVRQTKALKSALERALNSFAKFNDCEKRTENMKYEWIEEYLMKKPGVTRDLQKEWNWIRFQIGGKMFAAICRDDDDRPYYITLKLEPLEGEFWRTQYEDIIPGYYMNKTHWNSVKADGEVPDDILKDLLERAYKIVLGSLSKKKQKEILGDE